MEAKAEPTHFCGFVREVQGQRTVGEMQLLKKVIEKGDFFFFIKILFLLEFDTLVLFNNIQIVLNKINHINVTLAKSPFPK